MTNAWRYRADGANLGVSWRSADFPDSGWPQGRGLFYRTGDPLPAPQGTMKMAEHLSAIGTLKTRPKSWKDYYLPIAYDLNGN